MMWKVIGTFIVVVHLVISTPVKEDKCKVKRQLCGQDYAHFIDRSLCQNFKDCPTADDDSMPKVEHIYQIIPYCCETGCSVSYLKFTYCNLNELISDWNAKHPLVPNRHTNDQRYESPMWMYLPGDEFSENWLLNYYYWTRKATAKPIYQ